MDNIKIDERLARIEETLHEELTDIKNFLFVIGNRINLSSKGNEGVGPVLGDEKCRESDSETMAGRPDDLGGPQPRVPTRHMHRHPALELLRRARALFFRHLVG